MRGPLHSTAVFVDTFEPVCGLPGGVFFLTHAHTDHMTGLHRLWRLGKLHCSRVTADFLVAKRMCVPDIIRAHDLDTHESTTNQQSEVGRQRIDKKRGHGEA